MYNKKYMVVTEAALIEELERKVVAAIENGYEVVGGFTALPVGNTPRYFQPMKLREPRDYQGWGPR